MGAAYHFASLQAVNEVEELRCRIEDDQPVIYDAIRFMLIKRVVLPNGSTPDWCDHATGKWLILLRGSAAIDFDGDIGLRQMHVGDYAFVPPLQKHRITTTSKMPTVWLVVSVKEKKVATKCRVKKKRSIKKKFPTKKPVVRQRTFNFSG